MPGPPTFIEVYIYSIFSFGWVEANTLSNAATMHAGSVHNKQLSLGNEVNININKMKQKLHYLCMLLFCLLTAASAKAKIYEGMDFSFEGNNYKFIIDRNGRYSACFQSLDYYFKESNFNIPASVTYEEKSYPVTAIGENAFRSENLTRIYISENVDSIASKAFTNCPSLSSFRVNAYNPFFISGDYGVLLNKEKTTLIAFPTGSRIGLTFSIPTSVTSIANYAFYNSQLATIIISNNVTNIGKGAFRGCSNLQEIIVRPSNPSFSSENGVLFDKYKQTLIAYPGGKTGGYEIPQSVYAISDEAFADCKGLTQINVSTGLSIGDEAFMDCEALKSIEFDPYREYSIGDNAFVGCISLESINLPASLTSIGEGTFAGCGLTSISIPDKVTSIGEYAFNGCPLKKVSLGASLKTIARGAFSLIARDKVWSRNPIPPTTDKENFNGGSEVSDTLFVPVGSEEAYESPYPWYKFKYIVGIDFNDKEVVIEGVKYNLRTGDFGERYCSVIGYYDEYGNLGDLIIPNKIKYEGYSYPVTRIEDSAFENCKGLTSVVIPNTVTYIGRYVFEGCEDLKSATFPNSITSLAGTFSGCISLANFTIPDSVKEIRNYTFSGCTSLKNITIPSSVKKFGDAWFDGCYNLEELLCHSTTPPIKVSFDGSNYDPPFSDITYTKATLYVPEGSVEAYKTADIWSNFKKIVGRDFSGISAVQTAGFSVSIDGGKLNITGAKDKAVSVYTIGGGKVYDNNHYTGEDISVARGTYIVKAGAKSLVVTVK